MADGACGTRGAGRFLPLPPPGLAERREELPLLGGVSAPPASVVCVMRYHG